MEDVEPIEPERAVDGVNEGVQHLKSSLDILTSQIADLGGHVTRMGAELARLEAIKAVQELPAAGSEAIQAGGAAGGQGLEGAADIAAAPVDTFVVKRQGFRRVKVKK